MRICATAAHHPGRHTRPSTPHTHIGIGIIPMGPPAAGTSAGIAPKPAIAELAIRAGTDPSQVGGTDIAPTNRALPNSADIPAPRPR
ncbi:hypothetical protein V912_02432 [Mycobacterium tuberculosis TB_RSA02]|nr:hypothetical protein V912_02432 [Mycobacterium tuberculosis TB_RSA02]